MTQCLGADAAIAVGDALDWNVSEGLRHLQTCEDCRAQLETMRLARAAFTEAEPVDAAVLGRISRAVGVAARTERHRASARAQWTEALLAGFTALIVLASSGIRIESTGTAALGFALGATLMVAGRALARNLPVFAPGQERAGA